MFRWSLVAVDEDGSERPVEVFAERRREAIEKARHASTRIALISLQEKARK